MKRQPQQVPWSRAWRPGAVTLFLALGLPSAAIAAGPAALRYQPTPGAEAVYQVVSQGTVKLDYSNLSKTLQSGRRDTRRAPPGAELIEHTFDLSATLHTRVLAKGADGWRVAMRLQDLQKTLDGVKDTDTKLLESEFQARIDEQGRFQDLLFPAGLPEEISLFIRGLVEPCQVVVDASGNTTWTTQERSSEANSSVRYELSSIDAGVARIHRTKTDSVRLLPPIPGQAGANARMRTAVEKSSGDIEWSVALNALQRMNFEERTVTADETGRVFATNHQFYSATRIAGPTANLSQTVAESNARLTDESAARLSFYRVAPQAARFLTGFDAQRAVQFYMEKVVTSRSDAAHVLTQYVRHAPKDANDVVLAFAAMSVTTEKEREVIGLALASIALAGHREAQQALIDVLADARFAPEMRQLVLESTLSIPMPERFVPPAVWAFRESLPGVGRVDSQQVAIATNLYAATGSVEKGVLANTEQVVNTLGDRLKSSRSPVETRLMLVALGNVGDYRRVLPLTEGYFKSQEEVLRMRAFETFLRAEGDEGFELFAARYQAETSPEVLLAASAIAAAMPASAARNRWATEQVLTNRDQRIIYRLVDMLGREMKTYPANEKALSNLLLRTRDRDTRKKIYTYVPPTHPVTGGAP